MSLSDDLKAIHSEPGHAEHLRACSTCARILDAVEEMKEGLEILYEETADYIRLNNLGDVHHNRSMQLARTILERWK